MTWGAWSHGGDPAPLPRIQVTSDRLDTTSCCIGMVYFQAFPFFGGGLMPGPVTF